MTMREEDKSILYGTLLKKIEWILDTPYSRAERMQAVCELLRSAVMSYDWVGFYLVDPKTRNDLILGPYAGEPTDHTRIKFGQGICGQAAEKLDTFVIDDVNAEDNYLSCSIHVRSEIVLPIMVENILIGELDIDSHTVTAFTSKDEAFLKEVCLKVSDLFRHDKNYIGKEFDE